MGHLDSCVVEVALFPGALAFLRNWRKKNGDWKGAFERAVHVTFPLLGAKMGSSLLFLANTEEEELVL